MNNKLKEIFCIIIMQVAKRLPLKNIIVFESNPDFSDNTFEVYQKLVELNYNKKYKMYWMLNGTDSHDLPENVFEIKSIKGGFIDKVKFTLVVSRAKFIIDCNAYIHKHRKDQVRIHLKHGLPMKDASKYTHDIGAVDIVSVPSEKWIDICANEHGVPLEVVKPLGFPRNDVLITKPHNQKTIIWMPTYRFRTAQVDADQDINNSLPYGLPCINSKNDFKKLNDFLVEKESILYIRFHPVQDIRNIKFEELSNIILCDDNYLKKNGFKLYEFLCGTDALITDYSSIYYDYQRLNKPIAIAVVDFDDYVNRNGLLVDSLEKFKETYPATFIENFEDLLDFISAVKNNDEKILESLKQAHDMYDMGSVKNSAEIIINYLRENYNL